MMARKNHLATRDKFQTGCQKPVVIVVQVSLWHCTLAGVGHIQYECWSESPGEYTLNSPLFDVGTFSAAKMPGRDEVPHPFVPKPRYWGKFCARQRVLKVESWGARKRDTLRNKRCTNCRARQKIQRMRSRSLRTSEKG